MPTNIMLPPIGWLGKPFSLLALQINVQTSKGVAAPPPAETTVRVVLRDPAVACANTSRYCELAQSLGEHLAACDRVLAGVPELSRHGGPNQKPLSARSACMQLAQLRSDANDHFGDLFGTIAEMKLVLGQLLDNVELQYICPPSDSSQAGTAVAPVQATQPGHAPKPASPEGKSGPQTARPATNNTTSDSKPD